MNESLNYYSVFAGNFSLWLAIIIGFTASVMVLRSASRMGGGLFGSVLNLIGFGMVVVVLGTLSVVASAWIPDEWLSLIYTVLFSLGFILMVLGANKLFKGIMS